MPRLTKAKKEARDERKTAVAAQIAADAQTTIVTPMDAVSTPPPPPSASALSTNQPLTGTSLNGTSVRDRSTSILSDTPNRISPLPTRTSSNQKGTTTSTRAASGSKSPPRQASEMSTSEGSESESEIKEKSFALDGSTEDGDGDDGDEGGAGSNNGSIPEVKCMWEDCGQVFTSLARFINHLHDGE